MRNGLRYLQGLVLLLLTLTGGCAYEEIADPGITPGVEEYIRFEFTTESMSRAVIDDANGSGYFENDDEIGLYSFKEGDQHDWDQTLHFRLKMENNEWLPRITYEQAGEGSRTMHAYYPASDDLRNEIVYHPFSVAADQRERSAWRQSDLLWGYNKLTPESNRVDIVFHHMMFRLDVDFNKLGGTVSDVEIQGKLNCRMLFTDGKIYPPFSDENPTVWIKAYKRAEGIYSVFMTPQTTDYRNYYEEEPPLQIKFRLHREETESEHTYTIQKKDLREIRSGNQVTVRLSPKSNTPEPPVVDTEFAGQKRWVYGIKSPVYIPEEAKSYAPGTTYEQFTPGIWIAGGVDNGWLLWSDGCGWYDCNKTFRVEAGVADANLCWAAAASNLIHWWTTVNADYIRLYDEKYGNQTPERFPRPSFRYDAKEKSDIFKLFVDCFLDKGGITSYGVNWFVNGTGTVANKDDAWKEFTGFFPEVFDRKQSVAVHESGMTKEKFNRLIKNALRNKQAVGFSTNKDGGHAMNIWGVEFDEYGYVSYIYYADNNDGFKYNQQTKYSACKRQKIKYRPNSPGSTGEYTFMKGSGEEDIYDFPISRLCLVDMKRDVWAKVFGKRPLPDEE